MSKISVIVPVYNIEKYLNRCVDSVLCQTYEDLEVILVDDGSTDGSGKICDEYDLKDERVVVIHKDNGGLSSARNAGIDVARGDYIGFVDGDDCVTPDAYEKLLGALQEYGADYSTGGMTEKYQSGREIIHGCHGKGVIIQDRNEAYVDYLAKLKYNRASVCCKLFRADLIGSERFPIGIQGEDIDFMYRIIDRTKKVVCLNEPVYLYIHRENSITTSGVSERSFDMIKTSDRILSFFEEKHPDLLWTAYVARLRWILDIRKKVRDRTPKSREYAGKLDKMVRVDFLRYCKTRNIPLSSRVLMISMTIGVFNIAYPVCDRILRLHDKMTG